MNLLLDEFKDVVAFSGDAKPPSFDSSWRNNVVLCPCMGDDLELIVWRARGDFTGDSKPPWLSYKHPLTNEIPDDCLYRLEHVLDGTQRSDTIGMRLKK